ncbi:RsmD family RNA methyltransferase [Klebsiella pneumoniae]|uniref:RsmD family RNA methyltransferase n=1 Tax=Klebsiella pneumoniae TaxID=573 RepID=A0A939NPC8_KLEPN|nr:RsmD family RNA methyltransferase [Klebsiella pneumoniae]
MARRKLPVPESPACGRPPTGFAKPFNRLAPSIDAHCPIALPGSGASAGSAVPLCGQHPLLEMERGVAQQLQKLATLKADRGKVITTNTLSFLSQPGTPHQIVFVDPPFRQGLLEETLRLLETQGWLADEAPCRKRSRKRLIAGAG